jgi:hypothetical protein
MAADTALAETAEQPVRPRGGDGAEFIDAYAGKLGSIGPGAWVRMM